ncbi:MAG: site-specific tyrosine recombinase/integron integrase, partial [Nanoarchaeota archaeon]
MQKEMLRRKYSPRTIKTYIYCINKFLKYNKKELNKITKKDIIDFLEKFIEKDFSGSTINVYLQSIKFLMEEVLHKRRYFYNIKYSKTPKKLPVVLTKKEIVNLLNNIENRKHKLMIKLMYSSGLRVSELVNLRVHDFQFENNFGWVRKGKGNKDRLFIIAQLIKQELRGYIRENKLDNDSWLFLGQKNNHYSQRSIQEIIKRAAKKAKIKKKIHPHTLRHSFSTHLIENGYDVTSVQALLGHNSPDTTMIYLHMANPNIIKVQSPLDSLDLQLNSKHEKSQYGDKNIDNK